MTNWTPLFNSKFLNMQPNWFEGLVTCTFFKPLKHHNSFWRSSNILHLLMMRLWSFNIAPFSNFHFPTLIYVIWNTSSCGKPPLVQFRSKESPNVIASPQSLKIYSKLASRATSWDKWSKTKETTLSAIPAERGVDFDLMEKEEQGFTEGKGFIWYNDLPVSFD